MLEPDAEEKVYKTFALVSDVGFGCESKCLYRMRKTYPYFSKCEFKNHLCRSGLRIGAAPNAVGLSLAMRIDAFELSMRSPVPTSSKRINPSSWRLRS